MGRDGNICNTFVSYLFFRVFFDVIVLVFGVNLAFVGCCV